MATKIVKGFKDASGNALMVQGAGMRYSQALNSVAFGTETVASGKDQFAFGRYNIPSANKVEVVGGGNEAIGEYTVDFYRSTHAKDSYIQIMTDPAYAQLNVTFPCVELDYVRDVEGKMYPSASVPSEQVKTYKMYRVVKVIRNTVLYGNNPTHTNPDVELGNLILLPVSAASDVEGVFLGVNDENNIYMGSSPRWPDGDVVFNRTTGTVYFINVTHNESFGLKNIRTLGWDGTQWNAGDITCDDGHGNLISLRDLAQRTPQTGEKMLYFMPENGQIAFDISDGVISLQDDESVVAAYNEYMNRGSAAPFRCATKIGFINTDNDDTLTMMCLCEVNPEDETQQVAKFYFGNHILILMRQGTTLTLEHETIDSFFAAQL